MRRSVLVAAAACGLALVFACDEDSTRPGPAADVPASNVRPPPTGALAEAGADSGGDAGDAGTDATINCHDLPNTGGVVDLLPLVQDPIPGDGGIVTDGVYDLTEARQYRGLDAGADATGVTIQASLEIAGAALRYIELRQGGGPTQQVQTSATFLTAAASMNIAYQCPAIGQDGRSYTATPTQLTLLKLGTPSEELVFTKK